MRFTPSCVLLSVTGRTMLEAGYLGIVRDHLRENGMLDQAEDLLMASGKLQVLEYKEEIESALRTPGFGGFHLPGINDFPGQGTALVGMLNAFWCPKGYLTPSGFRQFCSPAVPLARMQKVVWTSDEEFTALEGFIGQEFASLAEFRVIGAGED